MDSEKVRKVKKKNKGKQRSIWQQEAINYHRGLPKGHGKGEGNVHVVPDDDDGPLGGSAPSFPGAPWWQSPTEEAKKDPKEDKEDDGDEKPETEVGPPLGKRSKRDDDEEDDSGPFFNGGSKSPLFAVFGP